MYLGYNYFLGYNYSLFPYSQHNLNYKIYCYYYYLIWIIIINIIISIFGIFYFSSPFIILEEAWYEWARISSFFTIWPSIQVISISSMTHNEIFIKLLSFNLPLWIVSINCLFPWDKSLNKLSFYFNIVYSNFNMVY